MYTFTVLRRKKKCIEKKGSIDPEKSETKTADQDSKKEKKINSN